MTAKMRLADRMTEAAEIDLCLNYSLMIDALDRCRAEGIPAAFITTFLASLEDALDAYHEAPHEYWKHDRVVRVLALTPEQAAEELETRNIPAPPAGDDGEHW
jgi:hypothetical protein